MPLKHIVMGLPVDQLAAEGLLYQDWEALSNCQRECITRLGMTLQLEQEAYLTKHPEVDFLSHHYPSVIPVSILLAQGPGRGHYNELTVV